MVCTATAQKLSSPVIGKNRVSDADLIKITKAEDARDAAPVIAMLTNVNSAVRYRAALAAGRIGDDKAIEALVALLKDDSVDVQAMATFAIGEVESAKGGPAIIGLLDDLKTPDAVLARAVEAAGKIAAANPRDAKSKDLGDAVLDVLDAEFEKGERQYYDTVRLGITAVLRSRPNEGDVVTAKFLTSKNARIRADAGNTLTRLRSKNANAALRAVVTNDTDAVARANAARALGAAEDKGALASLVDTATKDADSRVRVSAIRSLAALKDTSVLDRLVEHGDKLLASHKRSRAANPPEKTELLEIATALSQLFPNTENQRVVVFLNMFRMEDGFSSAETELALARVAPKAYADARLPDDFGYANYRVASAYAQGLGALAASTDKDIKTRAAEKLTRYIAGMSTGVKPRYQSEMLKAIGDLQRANTAFKPDNLGEILRNMLTNADVGVRATAAGLIGNQPTTPENVAALKKAFSQALITDKMSDDAQLGIMGALFRLDKRESVGILLTALNTPNYLVRQRAFQMLADPELQKDFPGIASSLEKARSEGKNKVLPYAPMYGTRLGQVLNTDADYRRALKRKNGSVKAVFTTEKGMFTIVFSPEEAPLTVDNFIRLARVGYFNGAEVHRVVANFVMQDGDPTGTGSGGPGHSIRCEVNMLEYGRGAIGMALSGKDTGGSQWFATHASQPHLDGGYTVFGHVSESGMKVVDTIVRGDRILSVRIVGR
jgi:cyclophilin family peptidyl-prolyl cis-trans isomerase/HEAT repeat protein